MMFDEIRVPAHSCVRIEGEQVVYVDPFRLEEEPHDGDLILVTHEHYDHYSPEDIGKVKNGSSVLICPKSMEGKLADSGIDPEFIEPVEAGDELEINGVRIQAVPAYNVGKQFHPKENGWVGYVVTMNGVRYYIAGDTDINEDVRQVSCDVALLPVGGTYTMTAGEAAQLAEELAPKAAIPTHYGCIVGEAKDGETFARLLDGRVPVILKL